MRVRIAPKIIRGLFTLLIMLNASLVTSVLVLQPYAGNELNPATLPPIRKAREQLTTGP